MLVRHALYQLSYAPLVPHLFLSDGESYYTKARLRCQHQISLSWRFFVFYRVASSKSFCKSSLVKQYTLSQN